MQRRSELKRFLCCQNDWIVTSSEALRFLTQMVAQLDEAEAVAKMQQQRILVSHVRIAETANRSVSAYHPHPIRRRRLVSRVTISFMNDMPTSPESAPQPVPPAASSNPAA
jgi:hypothetical protein